MYCILAQLTNSNVLGKSAIRDSNNRETGNGYWWIWQKYNTHVTVKDHIYEYTLTNTDNELYCYSNEFIAISPSIGHVLTSQWTFAHTGKATSYYNIFY